MAHRWDCPDEYEARETARRDASFDHDYGWGRSYRSPYECDEANDAYRREYEYQANRAEEEAAEERRRQRIHEERRQEEEYYASMAEEQARQEADERAYYASLEALTPSEEA